MIVCRVSWKGRAPMLRQRYDRKLASEQMLQTLFFIVFCAVSITSLWAVCYSRFRSPLADGLSLLAVVTLALLPFSQHAVLKKSSPFYEEYSGLLFAVAVVGSPLLLLVAVIRTLKKNPKEAIQLTWWSLGLSIGLIFGLVFLLVLVGYGDGA